MSTTHQVAHGSDTTLERVRRLEAQVRELRAARPAGPPVVPRPAQEQGVTERRGHDRRRPGPLDGLSEREREVLELVAEGCSNAGIAVRLHLSERTVEATCAQVFRKLGLQADPLANRRVQAVLVVLRWRAGLD